MVMLMRQTITSPPEQGEWRYEDWLRLPDDGFKYEVIDGELYMSPPPSIEHQNSATSLSARMRHHAEKHDLGLVLTSPVAVRLPNQDVPVQPDILFIVKSRLDIVGENNIEAEPDLVVEILSPSNWMYDRGRKQEIYKQAGVKEYWIVDYRRKKVDVLVLEGGEYLLQNEYGAADTAVSVILTGFTVVVADIFRK